MVVRVKRTSWAWVAVAIGLIVRLAAPLYAQVGSDGGNYSALGRSFQETGTLTLPWGDVWTNGGEAPAASHHYPPLYPMWDALFFKLFGFGAGSAQAASIASGILAAAVAFFATRRIAGRLWAPWVAALVLLQPRLAWSAGTGFSEGLVVALFTATLWALWESLQKPAWVLAAGVGTALTYLARSSMGPFFLVAILGGMWWRVRNRGWRSLLDPYYLAAGAIVILAVGAWAYRNWSLFHTWETSGYNATAHEYALHNLARFGLILFEKLVLYAGLLALYAATFMPYLKKAAKDRGERGLLLWLAVGLTTFIGAVLASAYDAYAGFSPWWLDAERYLVVGYVPLLWLMFRQVADHAAGARRAALACGISLALCGLILTDTGTFAEAGAVRGIEAGSEVGFTGPTSLYSSYAYMPAVASYYRCTPTATDACPGHQPAFIVAMDEREAAPGYVEVGRGWMRHAFDPPTTAVLYKRAV